MQVTDGSVIIQSLTLENYFKKLSERFLVGALLEVRYGLTERKMDSLDYEIGLTLECRGPR